MTTSEMIDALNEIIRHERKHFNFYLQAHMCVRGFDRLILQPIFQKEMEGELSHIKMFGDKVVALGGRPTLESHNFMNEQLDAHIHDGHLLVANAIKMEREVLREYHRLYPKAEEWGEANSDMSIVLLLEENIEHTTEDVEELEKLIY